MFLIGNSLELLKKFPDNFIDCCITSPPYWMKREYNDSSNLGLEINREDFIKNLLDIFNEVKRVLKSAGSFWLNIGDTYKDKEL